MKIPLVTTDGKEHHVCSLLFDDRSWANRFLVVDAGSWLSRRQVVIRTGSTDEPDWTKKVITANLTHQELVRCADASSVKPVSQQQQLALKKYFGWPDSEPRSYVPAALVPAQREFPVQANDDPHLRNTMDLLGYEVWSTDRRVGILSDFIMEPNSWHIKYLSVKVGDWVYHEESLTEPGRSVIQRIENFCPFHAELDALVREGALARWTAALMGGPASHLYAVEKDAARVRRLETGDRAKQCRLA